LTEGLLEIEVEGRIASTLPPTMDIVFIHGLGGERQETWQSSPNDFWPKWLAKDFSDCRVYCFGYSSKKLAGVFTGEGASLQDIASILADALLSRKDGAKAILFVCHSLGGLVVKQMVRRCAESADVDYNELGRSVAGVAFMGTPHTGSAAASAVTHLLNSFLTKQIKQLAHGADALLELNESFRNCVSRQSLTIFSYYETEKTAGIHIVDKATANPGLLGSEPIAVQTNHIEICKPANPSAPVYKSICRMVKKLLNAKAPPSIFSPTEPHNSAEGKEDMQEISGLERVTPDIKSDFEHFTTIAEDDRRDLQQKLVDAGREYAVKDAKRKKERFNMALRRHIAQPAAVTRYTQLMSDVESRFKRHVSRAIAEGACQVTIDGIIQSEVINPCTASNATSEQPVTSSLVDGAIYYLAGNCHLAWDNV